MGSRRRAIRLSTETTQLDVLTAINDLHVPSTPSRLECTEEKYMADELAIRRKRLSQLPPPLHPNLTDFGPASISQYLEQEFTKLKQLAARIGYQQEQELRDLARTLVNSKGPVHLTQQAGQKTFEIASSQENALVTDKGKKPLRKERERLPKSQARPAAGNPLLEREYPRPPRSSVRRSATKHKITPLQPTESSDVPILRQTKQMEGSQRRPMICDIVEVTAENRSHEAIARMIDQDLATSFETHASQSRDTLRSDEKGSNGGKSQSEPRRRRKTPVQAQSTHSHHIWVSNHPHPGAVSPSFDGSASIVESSEDLNDVPSLEQYQSLNSFTPVFDSSSDIAMADPDSEDELDTRVAGMASNTGKYALHPHRRGPAKADRLEHFDYSILVPEEIPADIRQARENRSTIWQAHGFDENGKLPFDPDDQQEEGPFSKEQLDPVRRNWLGAPDMYGDYPRVLFPAELNISTLNPRRRVVAPKTGLPFEVWEADTGKSPGGVLHYLSSTEIRNLRLVCKSLAEDLEPYVFRNVVTKFAPQLFSLRPTYSEDGKLELDQSTSMLHRFGPDINKFGVTFDYDALGLSHAPFKITETVVHAWFGRYTWPVKDYPYFGKLREIDKLLDDERNLLVHALKQLTNCRELAISLDSGHGWLSGPDISDLALYRDQAKGGSRVFGRTYNATDRRYDDGLKKLFEWAQCNTLNENIKFLHSTSTAALQEECNRLRSIIVRDYDSFREDRNQHDYTAGLHTGGISSVDQWTNGIPGLPQGQNQLLAQANAQLLAGPAHPMAFLPPQLTANPLPRRYAAVMGFMQANAASTDQHKREKVQTRNRQIQPQWPIIFNGYNISAECRGDSSQVQSRIANPVDYPLLPSSLTEPQAQWLMETSWIQKSFLSAYMDAIRINSQVLRNVHSLHLSKISSGILPQLLQKEFWSCLKGLRKVTLLVKPDWRVEHTPGDKFFQTNMVAEPITAAHKFADLLKDCIAPLEHLNSLHIGYLGGGEHQAGTFGRNQHIIPAPITQTPRSWLIAQNASNPKPHSNTIIVFPHVRTLRFENCWFSPLMLEEFMLKSRDTSLHNLILDSVSLTAQVSSTRTDGPLRTTDHNLKCQYGLSSWLTETIPVSAAWTQVLDKITPGKTLLDRKYDDGLIDEERNPRPEPSFRGNIQQITLKSCGYVKIMGIPSNDFNQNELVYQHAMWSAMDDGLKLHANKFTRTLPNENAPEPNSNESDRHSLGNIASIPTGTINAQARAILRMQPKETSRTIQRPIMLSGRPAHMRSETISAQDENTVTAALTGYLTQCIHPVEKRILEQNWGMKFGWGDDMQRWEAVEDGWFMGGTGRFGGDIFRDNTLQEAVPRSTEEDQAIRNTTQTDLDSDNTDDNEIAGEVTHSTQTDLSSRDLLASDFFDSSSESETEQEASQAPGPSRRTRAVRLRFPSARRNPLGTLRSSRDDVDHLDEGD